MSPKKIRASFWTQGTKIENSKVNVGLIYLDLMLDNKWRRTIDIRFLFWPMTVKILMFILTRLEMLQDIFLSLNLDSDRVKS